jgi:hypothetical protein
MAKFDLKKAILENKATFFSSLNEGQFSWMTQDTGQQIGSQDENQIPVYMFDDKGKYYYENDYEGYGVFGGKDYYELLDQMNGGSGDRERGIDLAFGKEKTGNEILFPALVTSPSNFNYKNHDFTKEPESDPNQSWYEPEEDDFYDQNDEEVFGDMDKEEDYDYSDEEELEEVKTTNTKMKKSEFKNKIKEMILKEMEDEKVVDVNDETPESEEDFLAELEGMLNEAEGLTPLQDYVYQYEIEISGEDRAQEFLDDIKKLNTPQDVYDYYAYDRDWSGSMDDDLNNIFKQVSRKFKNLNEASEFDKSIAPRVAEFIKSLDVLVDEYHAELYLSDDLYNAVEMVKKAANDVVSSVNEAKGDEEVTDDVTTDDVTIDDTETIDTETTTEVNPDVKAVQDALTQAQAAAQKLGDAKLTDQIGNTITFFTRAHVVEKGAVAEVEEELNEDLSSTITILLTILISIPGIPIAGALIMGLIDYLFNGLPEQRAEAKSLRSYKGPNKQEKVLALAKEIESKLSPGKKRYLKTLVNRIGVAKLEDKAKEYRELDRYAQSQKLDENLATDIEAALKDLPIPSNEMEDDKKPVNEVMFPMLKKILK